MTSHGTVMKHPLLGLFAIRRSLLIEALVGVSTPGFKALLAVLSVCATARVCEVLLVLWERYTGDSKLFVMGHPSGCGDIVIRSVFPAVAHLIS